jgi:nicotinamide mononucleotide transporter PnuC
MVGIGGQEKKKIKLPMPYKLPIAIKIKLYNRSWSLLAFTQFCFLSYNIFAPDAIPWADALASASAYTAMWLMAKKKVESWIWWIITNITSIPLYFIKGYAFTSVQFIVLLILAIAGLITWNKKAKQKLTKASN